MRTALQKVLDGVSSGFYGEYISDSPRERRYFSVYAGPFVAGDTIGAVVVHTNITPRRVAMAELEAEREILQAIAGGVPLEQILKLLAEAFEGLLHGSQCAIAAVVPEIASFHSVSGTPKAVRVFDCISRLNLTMRIQLTGEVCAQQDIVDLASLGDAFAESNNKAARELAVTPGMLLAIRGTGMRPIGLVAMLHRTVSTISMMERGLVQRLCAVAGIAALSARGQAALKQSEERYALAFEGANEACGTGTCEAMRSSAPPVATRSWDIMPIRTMLAASTITAGGWVSSIRTTMRSHRALSTSVSTRVRTRSRWSIACAAPTAAIAGSPTAAR